MTSTAIERVPLGASTLNRKWYLDIDTGTTGTPAWTGVFGVSEFQAGLDATLQDDSDFDSAGYKSQTKTAEQWTLTFKVARKTQKATPANYDPGQEALRLAADEMGVDNTVHVRWYEMNGTAGPKTEAYEGYAAVTWAPDGGGMDALAMVTVTLTGQGKRTPITHPAGA